MSGGRRGRRGGAAWWAVLLLALLLPALWWLGADESPPGEDALLVVEPPGIVVPPPPPEIRAAPDAEEVRPRVSVSVEVPTIERSASASASSSPDSAAEAGEAFVVTLAGVVRDSSGAPVSNAEVRQQRAGGGRRREAFSDRDGRFRLAGLTPGDHVLTIAAPGYWSIGQTILEVWQDRTDVTVELVREHGLVGTLRDELDRLVPGAWVVAAPSWASGPEEMFPAEAQTTLRSGLITSLPTTAVAEDGSYELRRLPPGEYAVFAVLDKARAQRRLEAWRAGKPLDSPDHAEDVTLADGAVSEVALTLPAPGGVSGRVTLDGVWEEGAPVRAWPVVDDLPVLGDERRTVSGERGQYELTTLEAGEWLVAGCSERDEPMTLRRVTLVGGPATRLDIDLPAGVVAGVVRRTDDGSPLADARVSVSVPASCWASEMEARAPGVGSPILTFLQLELPGGSLHSVWTRSDALGQFRVQHLSDGELSLYASAEGFVPVDIATQAGTTGLVVELQRGARLYGSVTDADDEPAAGVEVEVRQSGDGGSERTLGFGFVRPDGSYEVDGLSPGSYRVVLVDPKRRLAEVQGATSQTARVQAYWSAGVLGSWDLELTDVEDRELDLVRPR